MSNLNKVLLKEFQELNFKSFSENQIQITFPNEQDLTEVTVILLPSGGPYAGGRFEFELKLPADYPNSTPKVRCSTKIFHPNVSYSGDVCFNLFSDEWDSCLRLVDYAHALLWLLYQVGKKNSWFLCYLAFSYSNLVSSLSFSIAQLVKQTQRGLPSE